MGNDRGYFETPEEYEKRKNSQRGSGNWKADALQDAQGANERFRDKIASDEDWALQRNLSLYDGLNEMIGRMYGPEFKFDLGIFSQPSPYEEAMRSAPLGSALQGTQPGAHEVGFAKRGELQVGPEGTHGYARDPKTGVLLDVCAVCGGQRGGPIHTEGYDEFDHQFVPV